MPLVYRVENGDGEGPYTASNGQSLYHLNAGSAGAWQSECFDLKNRHPAPYDDSKLVRSGFDVFKRNFECSYDVEDLSFGFESPEQYRSWFFSDELLHKLDAMGFRLHVYDVPENQVAFGNSQCAFRKDRATDLEPLGYSPFHKFPTQSEEDYYDARD